MKISPLFGFFSFPNFLLFYIRERHTHTHTSAKKKKKKKKKKEHATSHDYVVVVGIVGIVGIVVSLPFSSREDEDEDEDALFWDATRFF